MKRISDPDEWSSCFFIFGLLLVLVLGPIVISVSSNLIKSRQDSVCKELHRQIAEAKDRIAVKDGMLSGQYIKVTRLLKELPDLPFENGAVVCPHDFRVYLGNIGELVVDLSGDVANNPNAHSPFCSDLLRRIQAAKVTAAEHERLNWNQTPTLEQLSEAGCELVETSGTVRCPGAGIIAINPVGRAPTCSLSLGTNDWFHHIAEP